MKRREFLATAATAGLALALPKLAGAGQGTPKAIAQGGPLKPPAGGKINVAIAISRGVTWIDFVGPMTALNDAFNLYLVSEDTKPIDGNLIPDYSFADAPKSHIVLVPAQYGSEALIKWLADVDKVTQLTMSVCTGASQLAKAGILDGRQATSHHDFIDRFMEKYPKVKWVKGLRFVEGAHVSTAGGLTAGIDLGLRVVERYFGRAEAQKQADYIEYQGQGWKV